MRLVSMLFAVALTSALVACADNEPQTSTFSSTPIASASVTTSETKSEELPPADVTEEPKTEAEAPKSEEPKAEDPPEDDWPEWTKNCLPFIPCFPPDVEPENDASDDADEDEDVCPPFDPICQTEAAIRHAQSKK